jgi:hypothetical protein
LKKGILLVFFMFVFVALQVMAQSRLFTGYDRVDWGSTEAQVREIYGIAPEVTHILDQNDRNKYCIIQKNISETITERGFWFIDDILYHVYVQYKDINETTANNLKSVLENKYGSSRTSTNTRSGRSALLNNQTYRITTRTTTLDRYSPDILVEIIFTVFSLQSGWTDTDNVLGENQLVVRYTWKIFHDEYQASRLGL